jgi:murein DD-endopeptidase MepM/ murein hydrolase activator NlpD
MNEGASSPEVMRQDGLGRRNRRKETLYRRRRIRFAVGFAVLCLAIASVIIAVTAGGSTAQVGSRGLLAGSDSSGSAAATADSEGHPAFARIDDRNLLLPVRAKDATIIAYQPVTDSQAIAFSPIGEQANSNAVVRFFRGIFSGDAAIHYYILSGKGSTPTGAILIGAPAGCPVAAPISGTVTAVKYYKLYGKYDDVQVDIRPEEMSGITFSILFIDEPAVSIGEVVTAGKTAIGKVRACPEELGRQLSVYTRDEGSHVFMQATEEPIS